MNKTNVVVIEQQAALSPIVQVFWAYIFSVHHKLQGMLLNTIGFPAAQHLTRDNQVHEVCFWMIQAALDKAGAKPRDHAKSKQQSKDYLSPCWFFFP